VKALKKAGIHTLGDAQELGFEGLADIQYVGQGTLSDVMRALETIAKPSAADSASAAEEPEDVGVEESYEPLRLHSPFPTYAMTFVPSRKVSQGMGAYATQTPYMIEFENGEARVSPELWFNRKFHRDETKIREALENKGPWRQECADHIKSMSSYGRDFWILEG